MASGSLVGIHGDHGVILLAGSLFGWLVAYATMFQRVLLFIAAMSLIKPGFYTDIIGFGLAALVILMQLRSRSKGVAL